MSSVPISGHDYRHDGARGPVWRAKYRLGYGCQVHMKVGRRGRPSAECFTKRLAEEWLDAVLVRARGGTLPGAVRTGATFADACDVCCGAGAIARSALSRDASHGSL